MPKLPTKDEILQEINKWGRECGITTDNFLIRAALEHLAETIHTFIVKKIKGG